MSIIVKLNNIQSIEDYQFEFPNTGIVEFTGDNSNGKSVLMKALSCTTNLSILDESIRKDLIRRGADEAHIVIVANDFYLDVILREKRGECSFNYKHMNDEDLITRSFADIQDLQSCISRLGFGVFGKERLCIQLQETGGPMPFVSNSVSPQVNSEIIESITKDIFAQTCIDNYKVNTEPIFRQTLSNLQAQIGVLERTLRAYKIIDVDRYKDLSIQLGECISVMDLKEITFRHLEFKDLEYYETISFKHLNCQPVIPTIKFTRLEVPADRIKILKFTNLSEDIKNFNMAEDHKCPTCGQYVGDNL